MRYINIRHTGTALPPQQREGPLVQAEEPVVTPIHRTQSGAVDTEYYIQQAHQLRADFMQQMLHRQYAAVESFLRTTMRDWWIMWGVKRWFRYQNRHQKLRS